MLSDVSWNTGHAWTPPKSYCGETLGLTVSSSLMQSSVSSLIALLSTTQPLDDRTYMAGLPRIRISSLYEMTQSTS